MTDDSSELGITDRLHNGGTHLVTAAKSALSLLNTTLAVRRLKLRTLTTEESPGPWCFW
jgi:hypothetical protein